MRYGEILPAVDGLIAAIIGAMRVPTEYVVAMRIAKSVWALATPIYEICKAVANASRRKAWRAANPDKVKAYRLKLYRNYQRDRDKALARMKKGLEEKDGRFKYMEKMEVWRRYRKRRAGAKAYRKGLK